MISAQPATDHFSWQNMQKWQNPLQNHNSDILHVAMQHSGLHTTSLQPTVDLSLNLPLASMSSSSSDNACLPVSHAFACTQILPQTHVSSLNDQYSDETHLVPQTSVVHNTHTHVQALLQLNLFVAQLLIKRQVANRPFSDWEHQVVQTTVSQNIWPSSFLSYSTLLELHNAIIVNYSVTSNQVNPIKGEVREKGELCTQLMPIRPFEPEGWCEPLARSREGTVRYYFV